VSLYAAATILTLLAIVQTTVMTYAALGTARPLLTLLAVVTWGLHRGTLAATSWGLFGGLMLDIVSGRPLGTYAIPLVAAATVVSVVGDRLFPSNLLLPAGVTVAATTAFTLAQRALLSIRGQTVAWTGPALADDLVPAILLNVLWLPVVYFPVRAIARSAKPRLEWET